MKRKQNKWRAFNKAKAFVKTLNLKTSEDWFLWARSEKRPSDIPINPQKVYKTQGWLSWGNWLGTDFVAFKNRKYRSFEEARQFARNLHLKSVEQWKEWTKSGKKPNNISTTPYNTYKNQGWKDWADFLGTDNINTKTIQFLPFKKARQFARNITIETKEQWEDWATGKIQISKVPKRPDNIPIQPSKYYLKKGWISWSDWLGNTNIKHFREEFCSFKEARKFAQQLGLNSREEWKTWVKGEFRVVKFRKKPNNIPKYPESIYKNEGWISWGDWLGTGRIVHQRCGDFLPFEEARQFSHQLQFNSSKQWRLWAKTKKRPPYIPSTPNQVYHKKGWISWGEWLGTDFVAAQTRNYLPFKRARSFVHQLHLKSVKQWYQWAKTKEKPDNIPTAPQNIYKDKGWVNWNDWLGK